MVAVPGKHLGPSITLSPRNPIAELHLAHWGYGLVRAPPPLVPFPPRRSEQRHFVIAGLVLLARAMNQLEVDPNAGNAHASRWL